MVVTGSKMGVMVKVGGLVVLVGVVSQMGMTSFWINLKDGLVRLLAIRIDSSDTEKRLAILSKLSSS